MRCRTVALSFACLLMLVVLAFSLVGCNNTLNPLCGSARPAPLIGSLAPATVPFTQVQNGTTLTITGSNFVSATEVLVGSTPLSAIILSPTKLTVKLTTGVISGPGQVKIALDTPAGNSADLGCTSGGKSSALMLTVN
ncbi:MAG TPA: IPT/TIG domain-containing protein [Candidatus Sulfotelmatobacter sp.]|nr:IPT/TIG domain-containing protein [Candidatus Sulfotelmatobacter sp.]